MSGTPERVNQEARELLRGFEKQMFALVIERSDQRFEWLMPVMKAVVLRDVQAKGRASLGHDSNTGGHDQETTDIQPPRPGAFEDQMFDCAAEGSDVEWRNFLRVPIEAAAFTGRQDLVERLMKAGGPADRIMLEATKGGQDQFVVEMSLFLAKFYCPGGTDKDGNTALHIAARHGRERIARTLLLDRADTRAFNRYGDAPLHVAVKHGQLSVARLLLLARADPRLEQLHPDEAVWHESMWEEGTMDCPLRLAILSGENRLAMMELLLRHGADVDDGEEYACSPLLTAVENGHLDAVNLLLEAGAALQDDDHGDSYAPISAAAFRSNVDVALSLLKHGSKPNVKEQGGATTLGLATRCPEMLDLLLRWGADEKVLGGWKESPRPTADERRVRVLLTNASQDRAWRRRGLPVLCRAFPDRCLLEQEHKDNSTQTRAAWMIPVPIARKRRRLTSGLVFELPSTERRGVADLNDSVADDDWTAARKTSATREFSRSTARLLLALREDTVFRHIVEYL